MDLSVSPGVDFFQYANGSWLKQNPIPGQESAWGIGNLVVDDLRAKLRKLSEHDATIHSSKGTDVQKVGDFWAAAIDEGKAEAVGLKPLEATIAKIETIQSYQDALNIGLELQRDGVDGFLGFYVGQDERRSDVMAVHLGQGGLGLPERDFYFNPEAGVAKIRGEYVKHIGRVLELSGSSLEDSRIQADHIMAFETELAKISRKLEDLRDPVKNYNKVTPEKLVTKLSPTIDWKKQFQNWKLNPSYLIVGQPEFLVGMEQIVRKTPVDTLKPYLRFHLVENYASFLNRDLDQEDFRFNHQILSGQKGEKPRWKRAIDAENRAIGFVLGRVFVQEYFPPAAKKRYSEIVEAFRKAYSARIDHLDWMSPATRAKAQQKLRKVIKKVGYPDKWKDYSKLSVSRNSFCENMLNSNRWRFDDMVSKFGKPVDRAEWDMTPQTYNAYYNPSNNEIVLPAAAFAIPGLKDSEVDDAMAYGYAGASTIGHEMTHGFDDEGRQFDAKGNLAEWWTKTDALKFSKRAELMVKEFNAYQPLPGLHINGKASLGENIADYGGILVGIDAFKKTKTYREGKKIAGLTPMQRFFLGYNLSWLGQERPEVLRRQLLSDVHAPAKWRVLGPLSNVPEFYRAFNIKPGQPMWRPSNQRVSIW